MIGGDLAQALLISNTDKDAAFAPDDRRFTGRQAAGGAPWGGGQIHCLGSHLDLRIHASMHFLGSTGFSIRSKVFPSLIDKPAVQWGSGPEQLKVLTDSSGREDLEHTRDLHAFEGHTVPPILGKVWNKGGLWEKVRIELEESRFGIWSKNTGSKRRNIHRFLEGITSSPSVRIPGTLGAFPLPGPPGRFGKKGLDLVVLNVLDEKGWHDFAGAVGVLREGLPKDLKLRCP